MGLFDPTNKGTALNHSIVATWKIFLIFVFFNSGTLRKILTQPRYNEKNSKFSIPSKIFHETSLPKKSFGCFSSSILLADPGCKYWFVKSGTFGKFTVRENLAEILGSENLVQNLQFPHKAAAPVIKVAALCGLLHTAGFDGGFRGYAAASCHHLYICLILVNG